MPDNVEQSPRHQNQTYGKRDGAKEQIYASGIRRSASPLHRATPLQQQIETQPTTGLHAVFALRAPSKFSLAWALLSNFDEPDSMGTSRCSLPFRHGTSFSMFASSAIRMSPTCSTLSAGIARNRSLRSWSNTNFNRDATARPRLVASSSATRRSRGLTFRRIKFRATRRWMKRETLPLSRARL